ncbi:hypothetical protein TKK_0013776 [Trichogramma kaykai]
MSTIAKVAASQLELAKNITRSLKNAVDKKTYIATEEQYLTTKCAFAEAIRELTPANPPRELTPAPSEPNVQPSLPKIRLPTFSGKQKGWESFKRWFKALVID